MKKLICMICLISILCTGLLLIPQSVYAEEAEDSVNINWDAVDWDSFWMGNVEEAFPYDRMTILEDWITWMMQEATLEKLLEVRKARPDGALATDYGNCLAYRFMATPQDFLQVLARQPLAVRVEFTNFLVWSDHIAMETDGAVALYFQSLSLPENATDAERQLLEMLIWRAEHPYDPWNPDTGDGIVLVAVAMVFSGCALLWLMLQKKRRSFLS